MSENSGGTNFDTILEKIRTATANNHEIKGFGLPTLCNVIGQLAAQQNIDNIRELTSTLTDWETARGIDSERARQLVLSNLDFLARVNDNRRSDIEDMDAAAIIKARDRSIAPGPVQTFFRQALDYAPPPDH